MATQARVPAFCAGNYPSLLFITLLLLAAGGMTRAATTDIWTGGGADSLWRTAANWRGGSPPSAGDSLIFTNTVRLANTNNFILGTAFSGITFATPSGGFNLLGTPVTLTGGLTNNQVVTVETIGMPLTLGVTPIVDVTPNGALTLAGPVSGAAFGVTKLDGGVLTLSATNTFGGVLTIAGGSVNATSDLNLGALPVSATPKKIVISGNGGTLHATAGFTINTNRGIALGPTSSADSGRINVDFGSTLIYRGNMANNGTNGGLTKGGGGGFTISGTNTYTGPTSNRVGTLTLDFTQTTSPLTNVIAPVSSLSLGGENAGIGISNVIQVTMNGKASATNFQTFNGTFIDVGSSVIFVTNGNNGSANMVLGGLSHIPGGAVTFLPPTTTGGSGKISTTATNVNGILGAWALFGAANTAPVTGIISPTNWASVDGSGNIFAYSNFFSYVSGNLAGQVNGQSNLLFPVAFGTVAVDADNASTTSDINTITLGGASAASVLKIGTNNILRLGRYGGVLVTNIGTVANNSYEFGDGVISGSTTGSTANQNSGTLTAGGAPNTPGEIVFNINSSSQTANNSIYVEYGITDNGTGKVSVIKNGAGPMKLRGHNTFSGNMYILQGRIQMAGGELANGILGPTSANTANPDGFGTGSIFVLPGGQAFPSGAGGNTNAGLSAITNNWFIAGNGVSDNVGAIRLPGTGVFSNGVMTLIGDARLGGGNFNVSTTTTPVPIPIYDQITGSFNLDFGATGNSGSTANGAVIFNQANNWSGNTTIVGRTGSAGNTMLHNGASDVIPDGFGKGNMQLGNNGNTVSITAWDLNGFNETINGLVSIGTVPGLMWVTNISATLSTLTLGNNNASGTFSGAIAGNLALVKIGGGTETLTGTNTYTGSTTVNAGALAVSGAGQILGSPSIQVNIGATLDVSGVSAPGFSTTNSVGVSSGTFIGNTAVAGITSLNLTNAGLSVACNPGVTNIFATTLTTGSPTNLINILSVGGISFYPTQFTIIKYSGVIGGAGFNFGIGAVPSPTTLGYVSNDTANARVVLVLNNGPKPQLWRGNLGSDWDIGTTANWLGFGVTPDTFQNADSVQFDDSANTAFVSLDANLAPASILVSNNVLNYTWTNSGAISGFASLLKQGGGSLTMAETGGDSFNGGVTISGGTVVFAADNAISGGMVVGAGTVAQVGTNSGTGTLPGGTVQNDGTIVINRGAALTLPNNIGGAGGIQKLDAAITTLSGNNTFTGAVTVATGGTLQAGSGTCLGTTDNGTTNASGSTLDVNGQNLGGEAITISGTGVGNNGAIINSGADQINALQIVTLAGDTSFGGTGRWDIRGNSSSLTANGYSITKIGANQVSLVGVSVDSSLNNINIQQGLFSIETSTTTAGAPSGTITVSAGATLQLYNLTTPVDKSVVLNGDGVATTLNIGNGTPNSISPSVGSISLNGSCIFNLAGGTALMIGGNSAIGGSGSLTQTGGGTDTITPNATYPGNTTILGGTLILNGALNGGGSLSNAPGTTLAGTGSNAGPAYVTGATVLPGSQIPPPGGNQVGTLATGPLTLANASLTVDLQNANSDLINVAGALVLTGTNVITPAPAPNGLSGGQQITIISYSGSLTGTANNLVVVTNPLPGYKFSLIDPATTPQAIKISVDHVPNHKLWVGGALSGKTTWDTGTTTNWADQDNGNAPAVFTPGDIASFDDSGTTNLVTLVGTNDATLIQMFNSSKTYTFAGPGKLSGIGEIQMFNGGTLIIGNSGSNDFTGPITINLGSLIVGDGTTNGNLGSGPLTNGQFLAFNRSDSALKIANPLYFGGSISNIGPGAVSLSANNTNFTGPIYVVQGTLRTLNNRALGNTNFTITTVLSGATLDIASNNINLGYSPIVASGTGVNNNGAIVNNSGSATAGTNFAILTMAGDTTFGGTGRLDFRSDPVGALNASLSTSGNAYKLTKIGTNQLQVAGVNVDPALGDIDVQAGVLGIQTGTTLGDPTRTLTAFTNSRLDFFNVSNVLVKNLTLNDGATVSSSSGTNTFGGPISLNGSNTFSVTSAWLALTNTFSGGATFVKSGGNTLLLYFPPTSTVIDITGGVLDVTNTGGALSLASGQTLRGGATLSGGLSAASGATVAPGEPNALGTLTVNNGSVSLSGQTLMNLNRTAGTPNSVLSCSGGITLGGTLSATNIGAGILRSGDIFTLFSGPLGGSITPALPALWPGLSWSTANLNSAGQISITGTILPPRIQTGTVSGNTVSLSGTGGLAGATYYVIESSNVALPLNQWSRIATNTFAAGGSFSYTGTPHVPLLQNAFYTIQVP